MTTNIKISNNLWFEAPPSFLIIKASTMKNI